MALKAQRLAENLGFIQDQVVILEPLAGNAETLQGVLADPLRLRGVKYALQTAIEAIIDSMYHICAQVFHMAPTSAQDAADILLEHKAVDQALHSRLVRMVGFRKRLVHIYQKIDLVILEAILRENLGDFHAWGEAVLPWLEEDEKR